MLGKIIKGSIAIAAIMMIGCSSTTEKKDIDYKDFSSVSVKITGGESGGSGVVLSSNIMGSTILTNKHICRVIEDGGYVHKDGRSHKIVAYKKYPYHDLCLIKVRANLHTTTRVASSSPSDFTNTYVSGHPKLLPTIVSAGHLSEDYEVTLVVGMKECDEKTPKDYLIYCAFFGGIPILQTFDSKVISAQIMPGSSGSPVLNEDKEVVGVVFAGMSRSFSYGFIVPHAYVAHFLSVERQLPWVLTGKPVSKNLSNRIFITEALCKETRIASIFGFCSSIAVSPVVRGN